MDTNMALWDQEETSNLSVTVWWTPAIIKYGWKPDPTLKWSTLA